jgi:hypothetical protein
MFFLRQGHKQKPRQYGPPSEVQSSIFANAERAGIDPGSIALLFPCWGPGDQFNYGSLGDICSNDGVFSNGVLRFQDTDGLYFPTLQTTAPVTIVVRMNVINLNNNQTRLVKYNNTYESVIYYNQNLPTYRYFFFPNYGAFNSGINIEAKGETTETFRVQSDGVSGCDFDYYSDGDFVVSHNVSTGGYQTRLNNFFTISGVDGIIDLFSATIYQCALSDSQIAHLSDNPYFLLHRIAPVFYSLPTGTVLPVPVNLAGSPGLNSITWSWQSGA